MLALFTAHFLWFAILYSNSTIVPLHCSSDLVQFLWSSKYFQITDKFCVALDYYLWLNKPMHVRFSLETSCSILVCKQSQNNCALPKIMIGDSVTRSSMIAYSE